MSEIELKPCPFCGNKAAYIYRPQSYKYKHEIYCSMCESELLEVTREAVISLWNTRPLEDALQARAEKAEAMVERLIDEVESWFYLIEWDEGIHQDTYPSDGYEIARDEWRECGDCSPLNDLKVENHKLKKELFGKTEQLKCEESENAELRAYRDGYDIRKKLPKEGQEVLIRKNGTFATYVFCKKLWDGALRPDFNRWWPLPGCEQA